MSAIDRQKYLQEYLSGFAGEGGAAEGSAARPDAVQPGAAGSGGGKALTGKVSLPEEYLAGGREQYELSGYLPAGVMSADELLEILDSAGCLEDRGEDSVILRQTITEKIFRLKENERRLAECDGQLRAQAAELQSLYSSPFFTVYHFLSMPARAVRVARPVIGRVIKHPSYRRQLSGGAGGREGLGGAAGNQPENRSDQEQKRR